MFGRFVGFRPLKESMDHFPIDVSQFDTKENFNVAPGQEVLAIARHKGKNHLVKFNWVGGVNPQRAEMALIGFFLKSKT